MFDIGHARSLGSLPREDMFTLRLAHRQVSHIRAVATDLAQRGCRDVVRITSIAGLRRQDPKIAMQSLRCPQQ